MESIRSDLKLGDKVVIGIQDLEIVEQMQESYEKWTPQMIELIMNPSQIVVNNQDSLIVKSLSGSTYRINPDLIIKYSKVNEGDKVKLTDDKEKMKNLQEDHGGWCELMTFLLGQEVEIVSVFEEDYFVTMLGMTWLINEKCVEDSFNNINIPEITDLVEFGGESSKGFFTNLPGSFGAFNISQVTNCITEQYLVPIIAQQGNTKVKQRTNQNVNENGNTVLHSAVLKNNLETCKSSVSQGEDINVQNNDGLTPVMIAAKYGYLDILKYLLTLSDIKLNLGDSEGNTALHLAIYTFQTDSVQMLLDADADIKTLNNKGFNACHLSAFVGHKGILESVLAKNGSAIVDLPKADTFSAIHLSVLNKHPKCLSILLKNKANINIRNAALQTPLHIAVTQKDLECIKILVENEADLNLKDDKGNVPLHDAMGMYNFHRLKKKVDVDADFHFLFEIIEGVGKCPYNPKDIIMCLIEHGAKVDIKDKNGKDAISLCHDEELKVKLQSSLQDIKSDENITNPELEYSGPAQSDEFSYLSEKIKRIVNNTKEEISCIICQNRISNTKFGCGHVACKICAENIFQCYICRLSINLQNKSFN